GTLDRPHHHALDRHGASVRADLEPQARAARQHGVRAHEDAGARDVGRHAANGRSRLALLPEAHLELSRPAAIATAIHLVPLLYACAPPWGPAGPPPSDGRPVARTSRHGPDQAIGTRRRRSWQRLSTVTVRTPSRNAASTPSGRTATGSRKERLKPRRRREPPRRSASRVSKSSARRTRTSSGSVSGKLTRITNMSSLSSTATSGSQRGSSARPVRRSRSSRSRASLSGSSSELLLAPVGCDSANTAGVPLRVGTPGARGGSG